MPLHGNHLADELREDSGLIAGAGADLEHAWLSLQIVARRRTRRPQVCRVGRERRSESPHPLTPTRCCASDAAARCTACTPCGAAPRAASRPTAVAGR